MERIRYVKIENNQFVTKDKYTTKDGIVVIGFFDEPKKVYKIINLVTNEVLANGSATSPHKLKIRIKDALTTLGVEGFKKESREKTTTSN